MKLLKKIIPALVAAVLAAGAFAESVDLTLTYKKTESKKVKSNFCKCPTAQNASCSPQNI